MCQALCFYNLSQSLLFVGNFHDTIHLVGHTIEGHRHNCLRLLTGLSNTVFDGFFQQFGIHVPRFLLRVDEHRRSTQICDGMRGYTERKALYTYLIASLYTTQCDASLVLTNKLFKVRLDMLLESAEMNIQFMEML